jgi:hypothetical protein
MKSNHRLLPLLILLPLLPLLEGCNALTNGNQAALNISAEGITGDVLAANPNDLPGVIAIAKALPNLIGSNATMTSASFGALIGTLAKVNNMSPSGTDKFTGWLDGTFRNANVFIGGGGSGSPETIQAAVANQVIGVVVDGMNHEISLYESVHGIPPTSLIWNPKTLRVAPPLPIIAFEVRQ